MTIAVLSPSETISKYSLFFTENNVDVLENAAKSINNYDILREILKSVVLYNAPRLRIIVKLLERLSNLYTMYLINSSTYKQSYDKYVFECWRWKYDNKEINVIDTERDYIKRYANDKTICFVDHFAEYRIIYEIENKFKDIINDNIDEVIKMFSIKSVNDFNRKDCNDIIFDLQTVFIGFESYLDIAVYYGSLQAVKFFIINGVQITEYTIALSCYTKNTEIFRILLNNYKGKLNYSKMLRGAVSVHDHDLCEWILNSYNVDYCSCLSVMEEAVVCYFFTINEKYNETDMIIRLIRTDYKIIDYLCNEYKINDDKKYAIIMKRIVSDDPTLKEKDREYYKEMYRNRFDSLTKQEIEYQEELENEEDIEEEKNENENEEIEDDSSDSYFM